jgi:hypothetical protein
MKGFRPKAVQIEIASMVTADLRQETAQVRHMMMGAGKTSVVTPICTIESFYTDIQDKRTSSLAIVLPQGLVKQTSHMLATELSPTA